MKAAGLNGEVPLCAAAMVPPAVGLMQLDVVLTVAEAQLEPSLFTARNCIGYRVPSVRPLMVNGLVVADGERVTQLLPLSIEYS